MSDTWWNHFKTARKSVDDASALVSVAPAGIDLDKPFDGGYGSSEGEPVLIWTEERVYFPVVYDGAEWLDSAPRNPSDRGQAHVGGQ